MDAPFTSASEALAHVTAALLKPENLAADMVAASPDTARKTLRWLRNLQGLQEDCETWLLRGASDEQNGKIQHLQQLIFTFAKQLQAAHRKRETIIRDNAVVDATSAAGALAISCIEHVRDALPDNHSDIASLDTALDLLPQVYDLRLMQPVERLLDLLSRGIERLTDTFTDERSPVDRLVELSNKITETANKLRSIDTLEDQPREESIELAREILRRLRNMKFTDKPIEEMLGAEDMNAKVALTAELNDLTENYRNLLSEAALTNPDVLQDPRVQAANDAVGKLAHSIKLLAAKEIPVSIAATQQISADITQMPEEWKGLEGRTADRLTESMEAGMDRAVEELMAQQQQQEQEDMQEAAQAQQHEGSRRKKRKRRQQRSSGGGAGRQRKEMRDHMADDYAAKQGRFREQMGHETAKIAMPKAAAPKERVSKETEQKFMQGLRPEDLELIKQLGGSLSKLNKEASTIKIPTVDVNAIKPDDKGFAQRGTDQQQRDREKPGSGVKM